MKKQLVLGLLGACVLSGNAQTFKEWQDPEINAINRAPMHANFFAYENAEMAAKAVKEAGLRLDLEAPSAAAPSMPAALDLFIGEQNR